MVPIEQKDGTSAAVETVDFPVPLPARCRGMREAEAAAGAVDDDAVWRRSGGGETIAVVGFDEAASGGHGGQPLIEAGGADAASPTQFGECKRTGGLGECGGEAPVGGVLRRGFRVAPFSDLERQRLWAVAAVSPNARAGWGAARLRAVAAVYDHSV